MPPNPISRRTSLFLLASLVATPVLAAEQRSARPLAIPLALDAPPDVQPAGHLVSEKYDGVRGVWDGRQLRFRSGLPVAPPAWWLQRLPPTPLDGELWLGRGQFEALSGAVRRLQPDDAEWRSLRYMVFDLPLAQGGFAERQAQLEAVVRQQAWPALVAVEQTQLPNRAALLQRLDDVLRQGGEGLVLRRADAPYAVGRSAAMLKLKPLQDAEAEIVGHLPGQGKHAGRLGALRVRNDDGQVFHIGTGFSDAQRSQPPALGQRITYVYRGVTEGGVPRFASFVRERPSGL